MLVGEKNWTFRFHMSNRRIVDLDTDDLVASAQILGWLAFPTRPAHGVSIIQQWYLQRQLSRGEISRDELPFPLAKPNRLQSRINTLNKNLRRGLRAGHWLNERVGKEMAKKFPDNIRMGMGLNALARRESWLLQFDFPEQSEIEHETWNLSRDYWTKNLPVIHLARCSLFAIRDAYRKEGREIWHLERTIFQPDWVENAIAESEDMAFWAAELNLVPLEKMILFSRA